MAELEFPIDYVPTPEEIRELGNAVLETALWYRGMVELRYAPEGTQDELVPQYHNYEGGTSADWAALRAGYSWIPDYFMRYIGPEPAGFDGPIDVMETAEKQLYDKGMSPVDSYVELVRNHLTNWTGDAANVFRVNYLVRIPEVTRNQADVANMLKHAMIANKDIFIQARQDLVRVAHKTIDALESMTRCGGASGVVALLAVVAAVATTVAAVGTAGALTPAAADTWTFVAGLSSSATAIIPALETEPEFASPIEHDLAADTVNGVLNAMVDAIKRIAQEVDHQERRIVAALQSNLRDMTSGAIETLPNGQRRPRRDNFLAPRPALIAESRDPHRIFEEFIPT